jgi:hypothetical protein
MWLTVNDLSGHTPQRLVTARAIVGPSGLLLNVGVFPLN